MKKWAILILSAGLAVSGFAQTTRTWDAGGTNGAVLTTAANWSGDTLPASTGATGAARHDALWDGSVAGPLSLSFGSAFGGAYGVGLVITNTQTDSLTLLNSAATAQNLRVVNSTGGTVGGIQIASGAGAFTIGAAGTANPISLVLGAGTTALTYYFANNSANTATIEENVTITKGGSHAAGLIFSAGNWDVKGVVNDLGAGSLNVNAGSAKLSANNTFSAAVNVNGGTLKINAANNLGTGTGAIRLGQTTTSGTLEFIGASDATISRLMRVGNGATAAADTGSGTIQNNGAGVLTFDNATFNEVGNTSASGDNRSLTLGGTNTGNNIISGVIANNNPGTVKVVKDNDGKWVLSGNNTFTGGVDVRRGTLALGHDNALGTGTLNLNNLGSGTAWTIQSADATARTITNAVTFGTSGTFSGTGNLLFTGVVAGGAAGKVITVTDITTEFANTFSGNGDRAKNGTGTLVFSGDNSAGTFNLYVNQGTLAFTSANALGLGTSALRIGQTTENAVLKYTGTGDATIGRLIRVGNGAAAADDGSSTIQNDGTGALTFNNATFNEAGTATKARSLTLRGSNTGNNLISGAIVDNDGATINVVKNDAGTWNLTGDNTFTGGLQIWDGVLEFDGDSSLGSQAIQTRIGRLSTSGTLRHTGASDTTVTGLMQVGFGSGGAGNGTIESSGAGTLSFDNATFNIAEGAAAANRTLTLGGDNTGLNTISGAIVNNNNANAKIALTKTGAGKWVLDGVNTYTGATTVENGTLVVNGSTAAGSTVTVNAGAILGGSGTIGGATTVIGMLNPGNSPGTLTFDAALTLGAASTSNFEIVSLASYDVLANDGGDTITFTDGSTIVFDASAYAGTANVGDSFTVLANWNDYSGTLENLTFAGTDLGGGKSLDTSMFLTDGTVSVIIPEPATIGMLGLGALITLLIRRQKQSVY